MASYKIRSRGTIAITGYSLISGLINLPTSTHEPSSRGVKGFFGFRGNVLLVLVVSLCLSGGPGYRVCLITPKPNF